MSRSSKLFIILLRIEVGWYFLYQGIVAILDSKWTLLSYIKNPGTFVGFYNTLAASSSLAYANYAIKGLLLVIGALLIIGAFVRIAGFLGVLIVLFFYFPLLHTPYVSSSYYIVDEHIIIALILLYLMAIRAGEFFGVGSMFRFSRYR